jgi:1,2-diacylglycerol 3-alpha-glucosyltransferase
MRIGLFTDRYLPQTDGVSVAVEILRVELEKLGHEVYIFAPKPSFRYKEESSRIIRVPGIKGLWGMDEHYTTFFSPRNIMRDIEKLNLDIFHVHTPAQLGLLGVYSAIRSKKPLLSTYHTDIMAYTKHYASWETLPGVMAITTHTTAMAGGKLNDYKKTVRSLRPSRNLVKWHQKMIINALTQVHDCCDVVIAPSEKIRIQLAKLKSKTPVVNLPTGVDKIQTSKADISRWRDKLALGEEDKVVLAVGRVGTEKNLGLLIKAFEIVADKNAHAKLVIVGPGEHDDVEAYKSQAAATKFADRIIFAGAVDRQELGAIYSLSTVLGFPSMTDTQGLVVNEAEAAGLPVVLTDRLITEVVVDGKDGYVANASAKDLAKKLLKILSDPKLHDDLSRNGAEIAKQFSVERQVKKLVSLYEQVRASHIIDQS